MSTLPPLGINPVTSAPPNPRFGIEAQNQIDEKTKYLDGLYQQLLTSPQATQGEMNAKIKEAVNDTVNHPAVKKHVHGAGTLESLIEELTQVWQNQFQIPPPPLNPNAPSPVQLMSRVAATPHPALGAQAGNPAPPQATPPGLGADANSPNDPNGIMNMINQMMHHQGNSPLPPTTDTNQLQQIPGFMALFPEFKEAIESRNWRVADDIFQRMTNLMGGVQWHQKWHHHHQQEENPNASSPLNL